MQLSTIRATVRKAQRWRDRQGVDITLDEPARRTLLTSDAFCKIAAKILFSLSDGSPVVFDLWEKTGAAEKLAKMLGARFEKSKRRSATDWFSRYAAFEVKSEETALQVLQKLSMPVPLFVRIHSQDAIPSRRLIDSVVEDQGDKAYPQVIPCYRHLVCLETFDDALQVFPGTESVMSAISIVRKVAQDAGLILEDEWSG